MEAEGGGGLRFSELHKQLIRLATIFQKYLKISHQSTHTASTNIYWDQRSAIMPMIKPATVSPGAPAQYRQPSRKGKKAWRKNVDVTELQQGLDEVRDELIQGYAVYSLNPRRFLIIDIVASSPKNHRSLYSPSTPLEMLLFRGKSCKGADCSEPMKLLPSVLQSQRFP